MDKMTRSMNQKFKLIYLMKLLWEQTDETHVISMKQIIDDMDSRGIHAERKSIYDDMHVLRTIGWDIRYRRERPSGYYLKNHVFEDADMKILIQSIQSSRLITMRKSQELVDKIKRFCSRWEAEDLNGKIDVKDRIKGMNESLSFSLDAIQKAISKNRELSFHYTRWKKGKNGDMESITATYHASPWKIILIGMDYNLIAYEDGAIRQFRIDQMNYIRITSRMRKGREAFREFSNDGG